MDWKQRCRARLPDYLDPQGDLAPPWARFPHYERHTLGWRMGLGEAWLGMWHVFMERLAPTFEARLAYLRRHPPAPIAWAEAVHGVLYPTETEAGAEADELAEASWAAKQRSELRALGLIASDVAYPTWARQQAGLRWPWTYSETPENAARNWTRELWFWSRQVAELRSSPTWAVPPLPPLWQPCAAPLATGQAPRFDFSQGLLTLAQMLAAGQVTPPWALGLRLHDFADSFETDMGYVDAFRLWGMAAFDDQAHLSRALNLAQAPRAWQDWVAEQLPLD